jgi:D-glycero-alpha-D-manno-heptose 1-phosphate guanylyltransferase
MKEECIILAGGKGTRLQSVISEIPKCMADVAGKPFLFYLLKYLEAWNFKHIVLALGYKSNIIEDWLLSQKFHFEITCVIENKPLGTGGAVKLALSKTISDQSCVMNGDSFFKINIENLFRLNMSERSDISLALKPMKNFVRFGTVMLDESSRIISFREKSFCESGLINGGIYIIKKNALDSFDAEVPFSLETDFLMVNILVKHITGYVEDAYFIDIGIPDDYKQANLDFQKFGI